MKLEKSIKTDSLLDTSTSKERKSALKSSQNSELNNNNKRMLTKRFESKHKLPISNPPSRMTNPNTDNLQSTSLQATNSASILKSANKNNQQKRISSSGRSSNLNLKRHSSPHQGYNSTESNIDDSTIDRQYLSVLGSKQLDNVSNVTLNNKDVTISTNIQQNDENLPNLYTSRSHNSQSPIYNTINFNTPIHFDKNNQTASQPTIYYAPDRDDIEDQSLAPITISVTKIDHELTGNSIKVRRFFDRKTLRIKKMALNSQDSKQPKYPMHCPTHRTSISSQKHLHKHHHNHPNSKSFNRSIDEAESEYYANLLRNHDSDDYENIENIINPTRSTTNMVDSNKPKDMSDKNKNINNNGNKNSNKSVRIKSAPNAMNDSQKNERKIKSANTVDPKINSSKTNIQSKSKVNKNDSKKDKENIESYQTNKNAEELNGKDQIEADYEDVNDIQKVNSHNWSKSNSRKSSVANANHLEQNESNFNDNLEDTKTYNDNYAISADENEYIAVSNTDKLNNSFIDDYIVRSSSKNDYLELNKNELKLDDKAENEEEIDDIIQVTSRRKSTPSNFDSHLNNDDELISNKIDIHLNNSIMETNEQSDLRKSPSEYQKNHRDEELEDFGNTFKGDVNNEINDKVSSDGLNKDQLDKGLLNEESGDMHNESRYTGNFETYENEDTGREILDADGIKNDLEDALSGNKTPVIENESNNEDLCNDKASEEASQLNEEIIENLIDNKLDINANDAINNFEMNEGDLNEVTSSINEINDNLLSAPNNIPGSGKSHFFK